MLSKAGTQARLAWELSPCCCSRLLIRGVDLHRFLWLNPVVERSIFQTFWKDDCCDKFFFFELETSNFGYLLIFEFSMTVQSFRKIGQDLF